MSKNRHVTSSDKARMRELDRQGVPRSHIAEELGFAKSTVTKHLSGMTDSVRERSAKDIDPPKLYGSLPAEAKRSLEDFRYFRTRYFRRETPNFHLEVAERITKQEPTDSFIYLFAPGGGKTTCVSHDYPLWRMLQARVHGERFACLLISKSDRMGRAFVNRIKKTLESNQKLQEDFGWFKPEQPDNWTQNQILVAGFDPEKQGKEPTFIGAGAGSHIYGWRVDLAILDDVVDNETARSVEKNEQLAEWVHEIVESRLEDDGTIAIVGTRFAYMDLYGLLLRKEDEDGNPFYEPIMYRAHDEQKCPGEDGPHEEYPEGCLLWPSRKRFTYKALNRTRARMGSRRFDFVYNQIETPDTDAVFQKDWIDRCKDHNRTLWRPGINAPDVPRGCRFVATLDPSPTQWACAQVWAFDPDDEMWYLTAIHRDKMSSPDYFDLMGHWTREANELGLYLEWAIEENSVKGFFFESREFKDLRLNTGLKYTPHRTGRNKLDPDYGVQAMAPLFEYEKVSLPWRTPDDRKQLGFFIEELMTYPEGPTDDAVMAMWFAKCNERLFKKKGRMQVVGGRSVGPYFQQKSGVRKVR